MLTLLPKQRPLLTESCFGTNSSNTLFTHLITANNGKDLIRRESEVTDRPATQERITRGAMKPSDEIVSDNRSGTTRLVRGIIMQSTGRANLFRELKGITAMSISRLQNGVVWPVEIGFREQKNVCTSRLHIGKSKLKTEEVILSAEPIRILQYNASSSGGFMMEIIPNGLGLRGGKCRWTRIGRMDSL